MEEREKKEEENEKLVECFGSLCQHSSTYYPKQPTHTDKSLPKHSSVYRRLDSIPKKRRLKHTARRLRKLPKHSTSFSFSSFFSISSLIQTIACFGPQLGFYGAPWASLGLSGSPWASLGLYELPWAFMSFPGPHWASLGLSGPLWAYLGIFWPPGAFLGLSGPL